MNWTGSYVGMPEENHNRLFVLRLLFAFPGCSSAYKIPTNEPDEGVMGGRGGPCHPGTSCTVLAVPILYRPSVLSWKVTELIFSWYFRLWHNPHLCFSTVISWQIALLCHTSGLIFNFCSLLLKTFSRGLDHLDLNKSCVLFTWGEHGILNNGNSRILTYTIGLPGFGNDEHACFCIILVGHRAGICLT